MSAVSTGFIVAVFVISAIIFFLSRGLPRQILLAICNAAFLASLVPGWPSWIAMGAFVLSGYAAGAIIQRQTNPQTKSWTLAGYIALLLAVFIVLKEYRFISFIIPHGAISQWISLIGLSYMLFRQIHYVVDLREGQIERTNLWIYLNYQFNAFGLSAGPIQRFEQFSDDWNSLNPVLADNHERLKAVARIMIGVLKVSVLGVWMQQLSQWGGQFQVYAKSPRGLVHFAALFYAYPAYIYFNFSGYCDVVIAGAALVGIRMPENFNKPYLARNPIDFWARWHMTLTHWIRDYVFTPLYKKGIENSILRPDRLAYVCFFIAMFLAGLWHGSTWNFAAFGLLHGAGVSATKMWEQRIIARKGRPGLKAYLKSTPVRIIAIVATINFVCFTLLFFPPELRDRLHFIRVFLTGGS